MDLEPLGLPLMSGRVAIAAAALTHSLFATFIVGIALIGAGTATLGHARRDRRYERLAYLIAFALVLTTATISFLGVVLIFALNVYWPRFWHTIFHTMFWPFLMEANLFLGEAVFAYAWYYLWLWGWATQPGGWRPRLHLGFIWLAAGSAVAAMFMIDITASYMLTPHPPDQSWANILNPTFVHLHVHRWFGNLAWAGFGLAGLCGIAALLARRRDDSEAVRHYAWGGRFTFLIGFGALLVMPIVGYQYLLNVRYAEPQAFETLMLGDRSWLFSLVALLYGILVVVGVWYIRGQLRGSGLWQGTAAVVVPVSLVVLLLAAVIFAMPYHLQHVPVVGTLTEARVNPLGKMQPYKYFTIAFLVVFGFLCWLYYARWLAGASGDEPDATRTRGAYLLVTLAVTSIAIMLSMGWVRETARASNGYLIYGQFSFQDERGIYDHPGKETP